MSVSNKALTLLEVTIFLGVFSIISLIVFPLLVNTLNLYRGTLGEVDVSREVRNIVLTLSRETYKSKKINFITDWELVFEKYNNQKSIIFQTHPIYLDKDNKVKGFFSNIRIGSISTSGNNYYVAFTPTATCQINSSTVLSSLYSFSGYAWSPQIGWFKFRNDSGESIIYGVCVDNNKELRGYAYNDIIGFIVFNCQELNVCATSNFKVKLVNDKYLEGFAWNDSLGWFFFDGKNGKVYLANLDQNNQLLSIDGITDPRVNVKELAFEKLNGSYKVKMILADEVNNKEVKYETALSLPFK